MKTPEIPKNEVERLEELKSYELIGLPESEDFDFITAMAAQICDTKISLISLITDDKQWFLSHHGLDARETPKDYAFCAHAINTPNTPFIIEDARKDDRFHDNPLTTGKPHVIFYAGIPLITSKGYPLGTLCAIDDTPKQLSVSQLDQLQKLAKQAVKLFELRNKGIELDALNKELDRKNEVLKDTQESNKLGSWEMDITLCTTIWSSIIYDILEVSRDFENDQTRDIGFFHPHYKPIITEAITECIDNSVPFNLVCKMITAKERLIWARITGRKVDDKLMGGFQDITDIKHNEIRFKSLIEGTNVGTWEWNVQTGETVYNENWAHMLGYTLEELLPLSISTYEKLVHPEDLITSDDKLEECFQKKIMYYEFETRMKHKEGHWIWVYDKGRVLEWTEDGKPLMMYGTHQEITERKQSQEMLTKLSTQFAHLTGKPFFDTVCRDIAEISGLDFVFVGELSDDGNSVTTLGGHAKGESMQRITYELKDTPCENVIGRQSCSYVKNIQQTFPKDFLLQEMMIEGYFGFPLFSKENKPVGIMVGMDCNVLVHPEKIERLFHTYSDRVTAEMGRTKSEKVRKELVNRFEHIGNNTPGVIYQFKLMPDGTMCFPYASSGIIDVYGVTPDQVENNVDLILKAVHPDDLERVILSISDSAENLAQWQNTYRVYLPSGEMIWVEGNSSPELQEDGSVLWHGFIQNITKRMQVDKEIRSLLDVTKEQNDRLRSFAQVISHNLRSHSAGISGILKLVDLEFPEISQHELLKFLNKGAANLNQTVNDLNETIKVNFSQNESSPIGIRAILKKNIDSLSLQIKEAGIKIINNVDEDLVVKAVPAYLDSIALNLITNAIKYRSKERPSYLKIHAKTEGKMGTILFEDNGQGIDLKKYGDKLFGMYKTFHNHEDSRGVGLFITKNHINSMGGQIKAESQVNEGTTFKITLPK